MAYDLVPSNLLDRRPAEASRAIRKKIKHGNAHEQYRALVVSRYIHILSAGTDYMRVSC